MSQGVDPGPLTFQCVCAPLKSQTGPKDEVVHGSYYYSTAYLANKINYIFNTMYLDATRSTPILTTLTAVTGAMFIMLVIITSLFTIITMTLVKSKRALLVELALLKAKTAKEEPVIYEEIAQLQDSLKSSSPSIDIGENTAYVSVNTYAKVSTL